MSKFRTGDHVLKNMGVRRVGTIIEGFYWRDSDDGTYKAPTHDDVPVLWDDGTQGYCNTCHLEYHYE